jgi:hypothetical protein
MSVRFALCMPAFILALVLLMVIVSFGAIVSISCRNRRSGFSYFAGGMMSNCSHAAAREQA